MTLSQLVDGTFRRGAGKFHSGPASIKTHATFPLHAGRAPGGHSHHRPPQVEPKAHGFRKYTEWTPHVLLDRTLCPSGLSTRNTSLQIWMPVVSRSDPPLQVNPVRGSSASPSQSTAAWTPHQTTNHHIACCHGNTGVEYKGRGGFRLLYCTSLCAHCTN